MCYTGGVSNWLPVPRTGRRRGVDEPGDYLAYMLRLWRTRSHGQLVWRASLENAHTAERVTFASIDALLAFIADKARPPLCEDQPPETTEPAR